MPENFDITKLKSALNLSDDEQKAFDQMFAKPERVSEMQRGWNTVSEGSRLASEAQQAKAEAERIRQEAATKAAANQAWFDQLKEYEAQALEDKAKRQEYEAYLQGLDIAPASISTQPPAKKADTSVIDPKFLDDQKQFRDQVTATATLLADLPFELQAISNRHFELYGKVPPPDVMRGLKEKFLNPQNKSPLLDIASAEFHFADREKELASAELDKEVQRRFDEKLAAYESANKLPGGSLLNADQIPGQIVDMHSKAFTENVARAGEIAVNQMSEAENSAFIAESNALAERGVHYVNGL